jgi:hypothetical protein
LGSGLKTARNDISPESINKGFKKCCVSNDVNGTENDILWQDGHEENSYATDDV